MDDLRRRCLGDNHFAVLFYGLNLICVGLTLQALWSYATTGRKLVDADLAPGTIRLGTIRLLTVPLIPYWSVAPPEPQT